MGAEGSAEQQGMRLRVAFLNWLACFCGFLFLLIFALTSGFGLLMDLAILFYLGAGIYLNRVVLRKIIEWHPVYNTLDNVISGKLFYFALWPLAYVWLFVQLGINKIL
jgi:hypothetical protein